MIVWLASYPRSGNTLLRRVVESVFGIETYSLYPEYPVKVVEDGLQLQKDGIVESHDVGLIYKAARNSRRLHVMKIHGAPIDDAPAIFLERDGRAACVSYWHYLRDFENLDVSLADVILGRANYESWSEHYESWQPQSRPNTLSLKFERLTEEPHYAIAQIAELLGLEPRGRFTDSFEDLRRASPKFFRSGSNAANIAELQGGDLELFWLMHGPLMKALEYVDDVPPPPVATRELLIDHRKRFEAILEKRFEAIETDRRRIALQELEADRAERGAVIARLEQRLRSVEADQLAKEESLGRAAAEIRTLVDARRAKEETVAALTDELVAIDGDRRAKDDVIARLLEELVVLKADHRARGDVIERLVAEIDALKARG